MNHRAITVASLAVALFATQVLDAEAQVRRPRERGLQFVVEIEGVVAGYFKGVDGLSAEIEVIEFQDGDDLILRKRPGRTTFGDITLKKGYIVTKDLQDWWQQTRDGVLVRKNISLVLVNDAGNELRRWDLFGCWPKQWKVNGFDGKGNDVVTEEITFVVEDMLLGE